MTIEELRRILPENFFKPLTALHCVDRLAKEEGLMFGDPGRRGQILGVFPVPEDQCVTRKSINPLHLQTLEYEEFCNRGTGHQVHRALIEDGWEVVMTQRNVMSVLNSLPVRYQKDTRSVVVMFIVATTFDKQYDNTVLDIPGFWSAHKVNNGTTNEGMLTIAFYTPATNEPYVSFTSAYLKHRDYTEIVKAKPIPLTALRYGILLGMLGMVDVLKIAEQAEATHYVGYNDQRELMTIAHRCQHKPQDLLFNPTPDQKISVNWNH